MQPVTPEAEHTHDPAPSRWSYRLHRMWLTPSYRRMFRLGLPVALICGGIGGFVSDQTRVTELVETWQETRRAFEERPEFMVRLMSIEGAEPELAEVIRDDLAVRLPVSSFDLDLEAMRQKVEAFNAVASATLRIKPGGTLVVDVVQREPGILWRHGQGLSLLDAEGHMVAGASSRADWMELPLIAGIGAERHVPQALALFEAAEPLGDRLRGLVRIGDRRWDIVLDRNQRILLPETGAVAALERLIALDESRDMLDRDLAVVDFRNPNRPTVRLNAFAAGELRRVRDLATGDDAR